MGGGNGFESITITNVVTRFMVGVESMAGSAESMVLQQLHTVDCRCTVRSKGRCRRAPASALPARTSPTFSVREIGVRAMMSALASALPSQGSVCDDVTARRGSVCDDVTARHASVCDGVTARQGNVCDDVRTEGDERRTRTSTQKHRSIDTLRLRMHVSECTHTPIKPNIRRVATPQ